MITTLLAAALVPVMAAALPSDAEQRAEQELLRQIHACAVEDPMPSYCPALLEKILNGDQP